MAKRKRLTPANPAFLDPAPETKSALAPMRSAPIADVAREASATAAAEEMARTLSEARSQGRMVVTVPLEQIQLDYLVRDRITSDDTEMQALKDSLRARGQQTPVELVDLGEGAYGLISGWRRCAALRALFEETQDPRFATVQGLLRQPEDAQQAYLAMVEENEIRVGLSYFERARIVAKSVEAGVFETDRAALQELFMSASRAKRSKIGSFLTVVRALDGVLRFPEALAERLGLALARALGEEPDLRDRLRDSLALTKPESAEAELALIEATLQADPAPAAPAAPKTRPPAERPARPQVDVVSGIRLEQGADGALHLAGARVDDALKERLIDWLRDNY
jgi:ParB-like chromosome segregation protein Spo0J